MGVPANPLLDLDPGIGQVRYSWQYQVLDYQLGHEGWLNPLSVGGFDARMGALIKRQLNGVVIRGSDLTHLNLYQHRVRAWMVLEDGSRWPYGVYCFTDATRHRGSRYDRLPVAMLDQGFVLDQGTTQPYGLPSNGSIIKAIIEQLDACNIVQRTLPGTPTEVVADPPNWPTGTSRLKIISELCDLAGWLPPHFDNMGHFVIRGPVDIQYTAPDHVYKAHRIKAGTLEERDNLLDAPNVYVVTGTGPSKGDISAAVAVDPALPHSRENRHFEVVHAQSTQGLTSTTQARKMAEALAAGAGRGAKSIEFVGNPDPRHDLYQTVEWRGVVYREIAHSLSAEPGGEHHHSITLGGFAGAG